MTTSGKGRAIQPAEGKLGILLPGMGAVATTFVAGVYANFELRYRSGTSAQSPENHVPPAMC
jgi:hypothetical protein